MFSLSLKSLPTGLLALMLLQTACDDEEGASPPDASTNDAGTRRDAAPDVRDAESVPATDGSAVRVDGGPPSRPTTDAGDAEPSSDAGSWQGQPRGPAALGREVCSHSFSADPLYPSALGQIAVDSRGNIAQVGELEVARRVLGSVVYEPPGIATKTLVNFLDSACNPTAQKLLVPQLGPKGEPASRPTFAASFDREDKLVLVNASGHGEGVFHGYSWVLDVAYQTKLALDGSVLSETQLEGAPGAVGELDVRLSPTGSMVVTDYWSNFHAGSFSAQPDGLLNVLAWYGADGAFQGGAQLGNADHVARFDAALTSTGELWTLTYEDDEPQSLFDTAVGPERTLAKVDAQGHVSWQKKLLPSLGDLGVGLLMRQAPDDSLAMFSPKAPAPSDARTALLTRYEGDGSARWEVPVSDYVPQDVRSGNELSRLSPHAKHTALVVLLSSAITIGNTIIDHVNTPALVELDDGGRVEWVAPLEVMPSAISATANGEIVVLEQAQDLASYTVRKFAR